MPEDTPGTHSSALTAAQRALFLDSQGDWRGAHEAAQASEDRNSAWVHAYLHRKEGDQSNAEYWYRRAGQPVFRGTLQDEWQHIANALSVPAKPSA